jgi:hypothetical protein
VRAAARKKAFRLFKKNNKEKKKEGSNKPRPLSLHTPAASCPHSLNSFASLTLHHRVSRRPCGLAGPVCFVRGRTGRRSRFSGRPRRPVPPAPLACVCEHIPFARRGRVFCALFSFGARCCVSSSARFCLCLPKNENGRAPAASPSHKWRVCCLSSPPQAR